MALPYANSKTNPILAQGRIEKLLAKFDVSQINFGRDYSRFEIRVSFILNNIPVSIPIKYQELACTFFVDTSGRNARYWESSLHSKIKEKYLKTAINASFAAIEDYLKAMLTMHQLGIMSIEEIFLPNIDVQGIRMIDYLKAQAPQLMHGKQLLLKN